MQEALPHSLIFVFVSGWIYLNSVTFPNLKVTSLAFPVILLYLMSLGLTFNYSVEGLQHGEHTFKISVPGSLAVNG